MNRRYVLTSSALAGADAGNADCILVCEVRYRVSNREGRTGEGGKQDPDTVGNLCYGSDGCMAVNGSLYKTYLGKERQPGPAASEGGNNWANFIAAVLSRKRPDLNADVERSGLSTPRVR